MTLVAVPPFSKLLRMSIADRYGFVLNQIYNPRAVVISIAKTSKEMMTRRFLRGCFFVFFFTIPFTIYDGVMREKGHVLINRQLRCLLR